MAPHAGTLVAESDHPLEVGPAWETVTRARNFAAHVPADISNPQMELLILLPQAG